MARPFQNTFDKESSPLSPQSGGSNTPISYQTNVNRQKTKKWADAKPANYGGDDWGDDDEFDLPPPPISKPTGLRQQGQAAQGGPKIDSPIGDNNKKAYGDLPPLPPASNTPRARSNSFDADDEKRNFSSSTVRQPSPPVAQPPATRFSQITGEPSRRDPGGPPPLSISTQQGTQPSVTGLRKASQVVSPPSGSNSPHPDILKPGPSNFGEGSAGSVVSPVSDTRTPSSDYQARRDFSPSAVPPPLATRASPAPQSAATDSPSTRFPARKSSLSQSIGPDVSEFTGPAQESAGPKPWATGRSSSPGAASRSSQEAAAPKPWTTGRSASPGAAARSPASATAPAKTLPFIRPADIYRRMEEEREKERQSMESGRPSMDSILGAKTSERSDSPAKSQLREQTSSDSLGASGRRRTSFEGDDASDSGRRLMPMLEPVKERKSEYGFEGFNVNDHAPRASGTDSTQVLKASEPTQLDVEQARRQSVSPKLPDLNRMSGFGMDMFSQSKAEDPEPAVSQAVENTTTSASIAHLSSPEDDPTLRNQPSLGFRSVVNQAFDRTSDASMPATPASHSGSGVRRTDSESTGTTGISPIMSRVPSSAVPESRNRDASTPAIPEVAEPTSPSMARERTAGHEEDALRDTEPAPPSFIPGHRRDISTPSPGNSPARTPDMAKATFPHGQEGIISEPFSGLPSTVYDDEPLQPPRPIAEREGSFRPALPGGWTSYATTARSTTPQSESAQVTGGRSQTPTAETSDHELRNEDDLDLTPTTTKHSVSKPAMGAAAGAAIVAGLGRRDKDSPVFENPQHPRGNSALPTPDPAMAPSGNVYSSTALDPRLLPPQPKLEKAPTETQLRPDAVNRDVSAPSSIAPTPPPKDTPILQSNDDSSDYFPRPTVPLKQKTVVQAGAEEFLDPPMRPQMLPTLSTDTRPYDEENDKLRKEIVKSLSPGGLDAAPHDNSLSDQLNDTTTSGQGRESTYLPSEYDNYWASTAEEEEPVPPIKSAARESTQSEGPPAIVTSPGYTEPETPPIPPLSTRRAEHSLGQPARPSLPNRFSWEESSDSLGPSRDEAPYFPPAESHHQEFSHSGTANIEPVGVSHHQEFSHSGTANIEPVGVSHHQEFSHSGTANIDPESEPQNQEFSHSGTGNIDPVNETHHQEFSHSGTANIDPIPRAMGEEEQRQTAPGNSRNAETLRGPATDTQREHHVAIDAALVAGAAALGGAAASAHTSAHSKPSPASNLPQRRPSLAEEKSGGPEVSEYPVSPTPPEDEHPSRSPQPYFSPTTDRPSQLSAVPSSVSPITSPMKQQFSPNSRILAFKEIAAMKSPYQRIQTFDETRQRFASMDSGLTDWMARLQAQQEEHANVTATWAGSGMGVPIGSSRSRFGKATGAGAPPLQQPYYQQYLNASSPTIPSTPVSGQSRPGPSMPTGSQQGFSPAGSKLSGQQVQSKGKDLLHTAGIFGGKAGKAGKGLLAKGKNKLRGSGAGDKTSPPPKPKNERRSSWGLPLALSRSSGRPDASSRNSKESTPVPQDRQRSYTSTSLGPPPSFQVPAAASGDSLGMMSGGLSANDSRERQPEPPIQSNGILHPQLNEDESRDTLGRPAPISKEQPSWDPFNATPIVEEEGFQYEDRPKLPLHSDRVNQLGSLSVPADAASRSERTNSEDTHFYDAPEEPSDLKDDWVMVSQEPENVPATVESEIGKPPTLPVQSILDRPRGSFDIPAGSVLHRPRGSYDVSPPPSTQTKGVSRPAPLAVAAAAIPTVQSMPQQQTSQQQMPQQQESEGSSKSSFLPPIRRTSTFGIGFGSRQAKPRFPLDDEEPNVSNRQMPQSVQQPVQPRLNEQNSDSHAAELGALAAAASLAGGAIHETHKGTPQRAPAAGILEEPKRQQLPPTENSASPTRPPLIPASSSEYSEHSEHSQQTVIPQQQKPTYTAPRTPEARTLNDLKSPQQEQPQSSFNAVRAADVTQPQESFRRSQEAWRPNVVTPPTQVSPNKWEDENISPQRYSFEPTRPSLEHSRPRGHSGSGSFTQRSEGSYDQRLPRPPSYQQPKLFDQPPSSAQRYPELFQPQQSEIGILKDNVDLPDHYYQAPLPREEVFLPRQQTNEYQLPGVGPPVDEPRSASSRRNSGFFRDLGGKISRGTSRERGASGDGGMSSPGRPLDSRGEIEESSVTSEEAQEQKKRRSSFFGNLNRASTGGLGPPQSRESMVAHHPGSRTDLLATPQPSPVTKHDRKRSFFGSHSAEPKTKPNKLSRASTSNLDDSGKKKRFSGLSGFFGKAGQRESRGSTPEQRPQATRELSQYERQPLESPQFDQRQATRPPPPQQMPPQNTRAPSQPRQLLTKLSTNAGSSSGSPRQSSKSRRPSASGLLSGIMGRRSQQQERDQDSRSSGSLPVKAVQQVPPAQTYTDLQEEQPQNGPRHQQPPAMIPWQDSTNQPPERGRRASREPPMEPQYDSVPIPTGYDLVRGQGAMTAPTKYDPRGLSRLQQVDPRSPYAQQQTRSPYEQRQTPLTSPSQQYPNQQQYPDPRTQQPTNRQPSQTKTSNLGALETYQNYQSRSVPRRLSREDLLARSPARSPEGQQRPYQLSLPEDNSDRDDHPLSEKEIELSPPSVRSPVTQPQHDTIQRLQHPILRHPQSPAGYPLPDDSVFSPINPRAQDLPPPPPPKSPPRGNTRVNANVVQHNPRLLAEQDLDRSNTHRTAVSGISQVSGLSGGQGAGLSVSQKDMGRENEGGMASSPSPTPPSVNITPERRESPSPQPRPQDQRTNVRTQNQGHGPGIKTTILNRGPSPDLYDASPRLPKPINHGNGNLGPSKGSQLGIGGGGIGGAKENERFVNRDANANRMAGQELERQRVLNQAREEKIFYGDGGVNLNEEDNEPSMSATSYPGQEWNPYMGVYEEGYD